MVWTLCWCFAKGNELKKDWEEGYRIQNHKHLGFYAKPNAREIESSIRMILESALFSLRRVAHLLRCLHLQPKAGSSLQRVIITKATILTQNIFVTSLE